MVLFPGKERRRQKALAGPFPEAWLPFLEQNVFLYRLLSEPEQARLRDVVRVVLAEKSWEGCAGLQVTDEMLVTIAGQAGILVLGFEDYYFDELKSILIYPGGYLGFEPDSLGGEGRPETRLGENRRRGPVILSWWEASWYGRRFGRTNVVLHEFSHNLAELGDTHAGIPPLDDPDQADRWEAVIGPEYDRLVEDAAYERPCLLHPYGAASRAESSPWPPNASSCGRRPCANSTPRSTNSCPRGTGKTRPGGGRGRRLPWCPNPRMRNTSDTQSPN
jgi:Mlc titration factor MtfA (ptsG expression regulator)